MSEWTECWKKYIRRTLEVTNPFLFKFRSEKKQGVQSRESHTIPKQNTNTPKKQKNLVSEVVPCIIGVTETGLRDKRPFIKVV